MNEKIELEWRYLHLNVLVKKLLSFEDIFHYQDIFHKNKRGCRDMDMIDVHLWSLNQYLQSATYQCMTKFPLKCRFKVSYFKGSPNILLHSLRSNHSSFKFIHNIFNYCHKATTCNNKAFSHCESATLIRQRHRISLKSMYIDAISTTDPSKLKTTHG